MKKIAVIGSGIAGLGCVYFLDSDFEITVYEKDSHVGGHSNTVMVREEEREISVDTGFMVYNHVTYPNLTRLFENLKVKTGPTSMSFSVQHIPLGVEYCGSSINHLFAQRKNLFSPRFIRTLLNIARFNREASDAMKNSRYLNMTLQDYIDERDYGEDFAKLYLIPMSSAVWSSTPRKMRDFPIMTLLQFFYNHGFLGMYTQHPWRKVEGGAKSYVEKLTNQFKARVKTGCAALKIERQGNRVFITDSRGTKAAYDKVILATHADQALKLLEHPTDQEHKILSRFSYQPNLAVLHTDSSVMPRTRLAWASWNYRIQSEEADKLECSTVYWMNNLQGIKSQQQYFVSINPASLDEKKVIRTIAYEHPLFNLKAVEAQKDLMSLNELKSTATFYCGSYFHYGFHEDAFNSSIELSKIILGRPPWR